MVRGMLESLWETVPIEFSTASNPPQCPSCGTGLTPSKLGVDEDDREERLEISDRDTDGYGGIECPECGNTDMMTTDNEIDPLRD